jgi:hypothetical protein
MQAIAIGDTCAADGLLDGVPAVTATADGATVAACIGAGPGLLDDSLTGHHPDTASAAMTGTSLAGFALRGR